MSSLGTMREITPLLPWRPAILSPGWSLRFTATKTLTIFMTPGGCSSPRCNFSTLLSKRDVRPATASSICFLKPSISAILASSRIEICFHCAGVYSASTASVISVPDFMPRGPPTAISPSINSLSRAAKLRSRIPRSSSRSFASRSISARSIASARSSLSTPRREKTRTSTIVPETPGGRRSEVSRTSEAFSPTIARNSFFSGRQRRLALGGHFPDEYFAPLDLGPDIDDPGLVQVLERLLADIRNVAGDLFLAELGVARHHLELLGGDGCEDGVTDDPFGDQDRILEVVAVPRHEGAQDITAKSEFAQLGRRTVGDDVARHHRVHHFDERPLGDAGVLVRALEFEQIVDIDARSGGRSFLGRTDDDAGGIDLVDNARPTRNDRNAGVAGDRLLHPGADERRFCLDQRHRLELHVRAHQRAICVVILEERDQRGRHRNQLLWRDVDQVDVLRPLHDEIPALAAIRQVSNDPPFRIGFNIGLGGGKPAFVHRREVDDFVGDPAIDYFAVRTFDEAVLVDPSISRQTVDQADIRALRRFDRADPAIMGRVHVTHLEARALAGQAARPKRRQPALVGDLRQRVGLIHELRELR